MNDTPNNGYADADQTASEPVNPPADDIELQREQIAETRLEMTETIDEIEERLNPDALKDQAIESVRGATVGRLQETVSTVKTSAASAASAVATQARAQGENLASAARSQGQVLGTQAQSQSRMLISMSGTLVGAGTLLLILIQRQRAQQPVVEPEPEPRIRLPWRRAPEPVVDQTALTEALSNALSAIFARGAETEGDGASSPQAAVADFIQRGKDRIRSGTASPAPVAPQSEQVQALQEFVQENQVTLAAAALALALTITGRLIDQRRTSE